MGDTILVHFKNFDTTRPHSMHFHGVEYEIASDGAYIPGVSGPGADVPPGGNKEFVVFFESQLKLNTIDGLAG